MGEIKFLSFYLKLRVCIMFIKVDELLNSYLFQPYFFHFKLITHRAY